MKNRHDNQIYSGAARLVPRILIKSCLPLHNSESKACDRRVSAVDFFFGRAACVRQIGIISIDLNEQTNLVSSTFTITDRLRFLLPVNEQSVSL